MSLRNDWTFEEIQAIYHKPLLDLVYEAATVHRNNNIASDVQICTLLSVKTGGCTEDCAYCPQAARYNTGLKAHKLLDVDDVLSKAQEAKENGSTRFCMGAAWREMRDNRDFEKVLDMVKGVNQIGLEVCCTMGMLT
ncbi:MAG: biotin synthase, partial [Chitinophagales bacterium]